MRTFLTYLTLICLLFAQVRCCNDAVCGSIISKCQLTQSCNCDFENASCLKKCITCLKHEYTECCSCIGLCPKGQEVEHEISKQSNVEEFQDNIPSLFKLLTSNEDHLDRWKTITFEYLIDVSQFKVKHELIVAMKSSDKVDDIETTRNMLPFNCTVAFWSECMSWSRCKQSCLSMGAHSYRWFHNGCCECVGGTCIQYGMKESQCSNCQTGQETLLDDEDLDDKDEGDKDLDYGDEDDDY